VSPFCHGVKIEVEIIPQKQTYSVRDAAVSGQNPYIVRLKDLSEQKATVKLGLSAAAAFEGQFTDFRFTFVRE
jgi:hypothetical protein